MKSEKKIAILLTALLMLVASVGWAAGQRQTSQKATHPAREAKGTIVSFTDTSLVLSQTIKGKKKETTFVLTPETQRVGNLAVGAKAEVHYRTENNQNIATWVRAEQTSPATQPTKAKPRS